MNDIPDIKPQEDTPYTVTSGDIKYTMIVHRGRTYTDSADEPIRQLQEAEAKISELRNQIHNIAENNTAFRRRVEELEAEAKWIDVNDRLLDEFGRYLILYHTQERPALSRVFIGDWDYPEDGGDGRALWQIPS